ncbi:DUF3098 domain-containing protein [Sunxiuqinia sp. sy24]|uniref:DUF3098 domain-containing protein n=1 Tax=Sunxiuqinia sp. sy24 TaxID=3461495 RepID=UPI0040456398
MLFDKKKYWWLIAAVVLLTLAYVLMSGPANSETSQFDESIFSFRRITLAPLLIVGTYAGLIYLILKRTKNACSERKGK